MDKPRHPNVIRTWKTGTTRRPAVNFPMHQPEDQRRGFSRGGRTTGKPARQDEHKEREP